MLIHTSLYCVLPRIALYQRAMEMKAKKPKSYWIRKRFQVHHSTLLLFAEIRRILTTRVHIFCAILLSVQTVTHCASVQQFADKMNAGISRARQPASATAASKRVNEHASCRLHRLHTWQRLQMNKQQINNDALSDISPINRTNYIFQLFFLFQQLVCGYDL